MSNMMMPVVEGYWRVYKLSIETSVRQGAAAKYISAYLESIGFEHRQVSPTMIFERGSSFAGIYNMNPKAQKTEITVDFATIAGQTVVELTMRVNCFGNRPLSKDYEFWSAELAGIEDALEHGYANPAVSQYAAERAMWYNLAVFLAVLILSLSLTVTGFIVYLLFFLTAV